MHERNVKNAETNNEGRRKCETVMLNNTEENEILNTEKILEDIQNVN